MSAAPDIAQQIASLALQMNGELFCQTHQLAGRSLAQISLFIEEEDAALEKGELRGPMLKESFRKFKAVYCLFLMQLESLVPLNTDTLATITLQDYLTDNSVPFSAPDVTMPTVGLSPKQDESTPFAAPEANAETSEATVMGNILNFVNPAKAPPANEPTAGEEESTGSMAAPVSEPPDAVNWENPPTTAPPVVELTAEEDSLETLLPSFETTEPEEEKPEAAPPGPTTAAAKGYYAIAKYFRSQNQTSTELLSADHLVRLESLQICFAIEAEFQERLFGKATAFWPSRKQALAPFWEAGTGELKTAVLEHWAAITDQSPIWPKSEKLPVLTFRNALKFTAQTASPQPNHPSLLESGLWIFFLGQDKELAGLTLKNVLGLPAFSPDVFSEVFLRLCRVYRLKGMLTNPATAFTVENQEELKTHAEALFSFTGNWPEDT